MALTPNDLAGLFNAEQLELLAEFADEAREEFQELKEKAPEWVKDARRKVADFLEPDEPEPPKGE